MANKTLTVILTPCSRNTFQDPEFTNTLGVLWTSSAMDPASARYDTAMAGKKMLDDGGPNWEDPVPLGDLCPERALRCALDMHQCTQIGRQGRNGARRRNRHYGSNRPRFQL